MRKILILAASVFCITASLTSCKKGEHDPTISLRSRKARLTGDWTVTSLEGINNKVYSDPTNTSSTFEDYSYNGSVQTNTSKDFSGTVTNTSTDSYTLTFSFKKDGTFTIIQKEADPSMEMSISGNWIFLNKNKNAKLKKKEAILLSFTSENSNSIGNNSSSTYSGLTAGNTLLFEIDQLKNKEIVLIDEEIENYSDDLVLPYTSTTRTKYTLVQK